MTNGNGTTSQKTIPVVLQLRKAQDWDLVADHVVQINGKSVLHSCEADAPNWGRDLLERKLGSIVKSVIVEPTYICKDHRNLFSNFYSRKFMPNGHVCSRLHFFDREISSLADFLSTPADYSESYIGYSVVRPVPDRCIGRSVWDPEKLNLGCGNNMFCLRTDFKTHILGVPLTINGYPYMSQDGESIICGQTALWGVCRYLSERYTMYPEVLPFDLVRMTGNEDGRTCPRRGLHYHDYSKILSDFGCYPVIIETKPNPQSNAPPNADRFRDICTYVESGFPVLVSVQNPNGESGHALAVIGHTLDYSVSKTPVDEHDCLDHTVFFKQLVVADDNFFPYQRLGKDDDIDNYAFLIKDQNQSFNLDCIHHAVCPLPEKVFLTADAVRPMATSLLYDPEVWPAVKKLGNAPWVTRLFLTTGASFKKDKLANANRCPMGSAGNIDYLVSLMRMPHFIWVMQVGPRDMYANQLKCTTEIVLDATAGKYDTAVLYARIGRKLMVPGEDMREGTESENYFGLYVHNLGGNAKQ